MPTNKVPLLLVACAAAGLCALSCGGDGGGTTPAAPPPLRPLAWSDVPGSVTVEVGEETTISLSLTAAVDAAYSHSASNDNVALAGESPRAGIYRLTITGIADGEAAITVTAAADGYATARGEIDATVVDRFDLNLWRELVFDANDCPNDTSLAGCQLRWGERTVEDRLTRVLPFQPSFHLVTRFATEVGDWEFSASQIAIIEEAIQDAVEQLTGREFTGEITASERPRLEYGWANIVPVGLEAEVPLPVGLICGSASVGRTEGLALLNVEAEVCALDRVARHEIGHLLGFFHVLDHGDYLMSYNYADVDPTFSEAEQYHAQLAYELGPGAPYTPDPRNASIGMTTAGTSLSWTLENIPYHQMIHCPAH